MDDKIRQLNNQIELLKKSSMGADEMRVDYFLEPGTHQWHCPADCEEVVLTMAAGGFSKSKFYSESNTSHNTIEYYPGGYIFKNRIKIPSNLKNTDIEIKVGKAYKINSYFYQNNNSPYAYYYSTLYKKYYISTDNSSVNQDQITLTNSSFGNLATCSGPHEYGNQIPGGGLTIVEGIPNAKNYLITYSGKYGSNNYTLHSRLIHEHPTPLAGWTHNGVSIPIYCGCAGVGFFSENIPYNAIIPSKVSKTIEIEIPILKSASGTQAGSFLSRMRIGTVFDAQPGCVIVEYK